MKDPYELLGDATHDWDTGGAGGCCGTPAYALAIAGVQGGSAERLPIIDCLAPPNVALRWDALRAAVLEGRRLQASVVVMHAAPHDGRGGALRVAAPEGGVLAGPMLDGPFSDVVVRAGGQKFTAHRVVLAAVSPVFLAMLQGDTMREAREAVVDIRDADPAAVELLLRHAYGQAVDVPLALAPRLAGLACQYCLASPLAGHLHLWLSALPALAAADLLALLPDAALYCPAACEARLYALAAAGLAELRQLPGFECWQLEMVESVVRRAPPAEGFAAAAAWVDARRARYDAHGQADQLKSMLVWLESADQSANFAWTRLLDAIAWGRATHSDLSAIRRHWVNVRVSPHGLGARLFDTLEGLHAALLAKGGASPQDAHTHVPSWAAGYMHGAFPAA